MSSRIRRQKTISFQNVKMEHVLGMQGNGYLDAENFSKWMTFFITYHEKENLALTKKMLLILDGHKSHVIMEVLLKAKSYRVDVVSFLSHTSHALHSLDILCFKPFKQSLRAYKDFWARRNISNKAKKEDLAQWVSLALRNALTVKNIQARFRPISIKPLNEDAMVDKMGANEVFQHL